MRTSLPAPDSAQLADAAGSWRSAYVHIPFCRRRCPYCDFAVVAHDELTGDPAASIDSYVEALLAEIAMEPPWTPLDAVNLGGGTPSTLSGRQLERIVLALEERFGMADDAERSIEANPEDVTEGWVAQVVAAGFNRVSLGAQSFDATILGVLGRQHRAADIARAVRTLRDGGVVSVSLDLIFGTPGESLASWRSTVRAALAEGLNHLSGYALTAEPGTEMWRQIRRGGPAPDPDHQADQYEILQELAQRGGLVRYEVSNWAEPRHPCRYNLATWAQGEYVAFGLGAHGHRDGWRTRNVRNLRTYLDRVAAGQRPLRAREAQSAFSAEQERLILGLRRRAGVRAGRMGEALLASGEGERLVDADIVGREGDRLVVRQPLFTDAVARSVLSLAPGEC